MEASGRWAFAFPALGRLKFVALLRGSQWILIPGCEPRLMNEGDVCLLGRTAYAVASHPAEDQIDGQLLFADSDAVHHHGDDTIGIGGSVTFDSEDAGFLLAMLPTFAILPRSSPSTDVVTTILGLIAAEPDQGRMGSDVVAARLADVLLVEAIRTYADRLTTTDVGWLAALADARIGRTIRAIHHDVSQPWTLAGLADLAGMSRSAYSAEFSRLVGRPPLTYIRAWRLTLARVALTRGEATVAGIADRVGYTSPGAFSQAYRRTFGTSPKSPSSS